MPSRDLTLVAAVLDTLVPPQPEKALAGAGRPVVVDYVQRRLAAAPELAAVVDLGLDAVVACAQARHNAHFAQLDAAQRSAVLREVETTQVFLIPILLLNTYTGFYQQPDVLAAQGYPARPPFPEGHQVLVKDDALLARWRERARERA
jgi:Gluconate 2-dehydrogenase subunit 3